MGMDDLLLGLKALGLTGQDFVTVNDQSIRAADLGIAVMANLAEKTPPLPEEVAPACSDSFVEVSGWRNGEPIQIHLHHCSDNGLPRMDEGTGLSAAVGILMVGRGDINRPGVHAPEGCVQPQHFFAELKQHGITVVERCRETR
jgi:saccharopine dehydrogenase (NAD+, L-lysine-forming)